MRNAWAAGIVLAACGILAPQASGFGTLDGEFGQRGEHEKITRAALACKPGQTPTPDCFDPVSIAQLAGRPGEAGAVGAPDIPGPHGESGNPAAHCDAADFYRPRDGQPKYPRTRGEATAMLHACRAHLRGAFLSGLLGAAELVDFQGRIQPGEARVSQDDECSFYPRVSGRAKCDAFEGLGRALHGVQDFYSHSNWSDRRVKDPSVENPPGLANIQIADLMNMLLSVDPKVEGELTTGCFHVQEFLIGRDQAGDCEDRVSHAFINKDKGLIDPLTGAASDPQTTRGKAGGGANLRNAVRLAILDTQRQWRDFRTGLQALYPSAAGRMICALTRDDPLHQCQGRRIAITIDSSGSNQDTDPNDLRVDAARALNDNLLSQAEAGPGGTPDLSAVITFTDDARVCSRLADPPRASFSCVESDGGTSIASGIRAATAELTRDVSPETVRDRSGIVVFTDGLDNDVFSIVRAIHDAAALGIRVSVGLLDPVDVTPPTPPPPPPPPPRPRRIEAAQSNDPPPAYVRAILDSGGVYGTISSAEDQRAFVRLVDSNGATNLDDPNGQQDGGPLVADIASSGAIADRRDTDTFIFNATAGRIVDFGVRPLIAGSLDVRLRDVATGRLLTRSRRLVKGAVGVRARPRVSGLIEVTVAPVKGARVPADTGAPYTIHVHEFGVDLVGTEGPDALRCGDAATYVQAGAGADSVACGPGHDTIVGGRDADAMTGGRGNDVFLVATPDLGGTGTETVDGGAGKDRVELPFKRPPGTRCRKGSASFARKGARWKLRGVERIVFRGRTC